MNLDRYHALTDEIPDGQDCPCGRCVFCDRQLRHYNDGGRGFIANAMLDGDHAQFLYCMEGGCADDESFLEDHRALWTCNDCGIDNLQDSCAACHGPRSLLCRSLTNFDRDPIGIDGVVAYLGRAVPKNGFVEVRLNLVLRTPLSLCFDKPPTRDELVSGLVGNLAAYLKICNESGPDDILDMLKVIGFSPVYPS